jgi:glycolate oxidase FAD binding subunit
VSNRFNPDVAPPFKITLDFDRKSIVSTATDTLPLREIQQVEDAAAAASLIQGCFERDTAIYPLGGRTSLQFGLPGHREGIGLSVQKLASVIDYPARDMTITVEAGVTMRQLAKTLAGEQQRLPVDVPDSDRATIGGVVATNSNGPRRFGLGNLRDYVIGITAIDGRGIPFCGGGRVVKNVAGYDFCKLLTGSMGTLGVIVQLTLRVMPQPETTALLGCAVADLDAAEKLLDTLVESPLRPVAVELLGGPQWREEPRLTSLLPASDAGFMVAVALEGTSVEVDWMANQLGSQWDQLGVEGWSRVDDIQALALMEVFAQFPSPGESPLVLQASVVPSATTRFIAAVRALDRRCAVQAHAGSGIVIVKLSEFPAKGLVKTLIGKLQPAAKKMLGNVIILANPTGQEMTRQSVWGGAEFACDLMQEVKAQFDPKNLLNPGRFVYGQ